MNKDEYQLGVELYDAKELYKRTCDKLAISESEHSDLKEVGEVLLAKFESQSDAPTQAEKKRAAKLRPEYSTYLEGLSEARAAHLQAKYREKSGSAEMKALITLISLEKSKMEMR